jgi:hypothetical protein
MKYELLFDGTLGNWKTKPVSFQLKEGASPYYSRAFPVPRIHKETLIKEVERLVQLGVLEWQPALEWASPSFIMPKKNRTICFLSNFWETKKRLVRKPFPIPKICTVLQELEGFTFATALYLNMGYYTIRLDTNASRICTIIFPWGKYSYKRLPMGIAGSPDIFQSKMLELMEDLEYVQAYLDDLLCISRSSLEDHLSNFWEVNKRLVRKPFPIPKISMVLQELEGFTFVTALDLNMGYYTIRLDPDATRICTVIFLGGKYSYKRLPMGIACSPDIFQSKMLELMENLEYVQAYLDDLLCISRSSLEDHHKKLEEVLGRLRNAGLIVNAEKSTFCALEIEYLGYILTRDGIKPHSNKVQTILGIQPLQNVKELRHFLGMVQYYCDLWARWSKMLAPLTSLVGECGQTKVTRVKETKKVPWH